jgi:predicted transcriptional regulator
MARNLTERFSVRLDPETRGRLKAQAEVEDRKPGNLARRLISEGLQRREQEAAGAR